MPAADPRHANAGSRAAAKLCQAHGSAQISKESISARRKSGQTQTHAQKLLEGRKSASPPSPLRALLCSTSSNRRRRSEKDQPLAKAAFTKVERAAKANGRRAAAATGASLRRKGKQTRTVPGPWFPLEWKRDRMRGKLKVTNPRRPSAPCAAAGGGEVTGTAGHQSIPAGTHGGGSIPPRNGTDAPPPPPPPSPPQLSRDPLTGRRTARGS